jgi:hypothetical protein
MADVNVDTLSVQIVADTTSATSNLKKLRNTLTELSAVAKGFNTGSAQKIQSFAASLKRSRGILSGLNTSGLEKIKSFAASLKTTGNAFDTLGSMDTSKINAMAQNVKIASQLLASIDGAGLENISKLAQSVASLTNIKGLEKTINQLMRLGVIDFSNMNTKKLDETIAKVKELQEAAGRTSGGGTGDGDVTPGEVTPKHPKTGDADVKDFRAKLRDLGKAAKDSMSAFAGLYSSFVRIAKYRAIRAVLSSITNGIKTGINDLYQYSKALSGSFANSLDKASTSMLYFKNSIGATASPLVESFVPALDFVIDKIVSLLNWLNQLFSALSGKSTWTKAVKVQTQYASAASSAAKSTSDEAKALKDLTASFDELNILSDSSSALSSSNTTTPDYSDMFEEVGIENGIADFAAKVKLTFDDVFFNWDDLNAETILKKISVGLGAITGAIIGWEFGGVGGALVGSIIGAGLGILFDIATFNNDGELSKEEVAKAITAVVLGLAGSVLGSTGGIGGAALGFSAGAGLSLLVSKLFFDNDGELSKEEIANLVTIAVFGITGGIIGAYTGKSVRAAGIGFSAFAFFGMTLTNLMFDNDGVLGKEEIATIVIAAVFGITGGILGAYIGKSVQAAGIGFSCFAYLGVVLSNFFFNNDGQISATEVKRMVVVAIYAITGGIIGAIIGGASGAMIGIGIGAVLGVTISKLAFLDDGANVQSVAQDYGANIGAGIKEGIASEFAPQKISMYTENEIKQPLTNSIQEKFDIHSPSRVMQEQGEFIGEGLLKGIASVFTTIPAWINSNVFTPFTTAFKSSFGIDNNTSTVTDDYGKSLAKGLEKGISDNIKEDDYETLFDRIKDGFSSAWDTLQKWWDSLSLSQLDFKLPHFEWTSGDTEATGIIAQALEALNLPTSIPKLNVKWYATGGFVDNGQMFVAREAGAELVGSIGSRTAVVNNDQIVESVSEGVYEAVLAAMSKMQGNDNNAVYVYLDGKQITAAVEERQRTRGATIYSGGVL